MHLMVLIDQSVHASEVNEIVLTEVNESATKYIY